MNHFDAEGRARMVDVSAKAESERTACASGSVKVSREVLSAIRSGNVKKGDVLGVARIAGIMGAKRTSELIPLCHPIPLTACTLEWEIDEASRRVTALCTVRCTGRTGVEMEALTGVSTALLAVYDMCKSMDRGMVIEDIRLLHKAGGKSGEWNHPGDGAEAEAET